MDGVKPSNTKLRKRCMPTELPPQLVPTCAGRGVWQSAQRFPTTVNLVFLHRSRYFFHSDSSSTMFTRQNGPRFRHNICEKMW
jgi:hypothetical protein